MGFSLDRAGFGMRLLAGVLDTLIIVIPIGVVVSLYTGTPSLNWTQGVTWNSLYLLYSIILPVIWGGFNIGKRLVNIRIKKTNGKELNLADMFFREFIGKFLIGYVTLGLSTVVSVFMIVFRKDKRAIHDFAAGTFVSNEG
ncbi:RDD family protein [Halobacillus litoralis]|uniref:RDD family protein n=1 Tax=Halobacillus litoralis TaxID=45668 RepID=A0A845DUB1_9BACI|nr:RDD family protein [Halobacillus litoralis]MYL20986.1 RDD family protein [Halobacillus litoralis]MYL38370.1 RDD family protein [Halobacillus litoralis]